MITIIIYFYDLSLLGPTICVEGLCVEEWENVENWMIDQEGVEEAVEKAKKKAKVSFL